MADIQTIIDAAQAEIEADRDWLIGLVRDMVRIPSVNPKFEANPAINREADVQALLEPILKHDGFKTEQWDALPGRPNLVGEWAGSEDRSLILCGHIDVVPVGEMKDWSVDPFGGEITDGRLYGRGAVDMKGGVAACVAAAHAIRKAGITLQGRLAIHSVVDEEAGGFGAMDAVKKGKLAKAVLVAEPTWGDVLPVEGGLEWARVTIRGRNAHSALRYNEIYPQRHDKGRLKPGVNAIEIAARFIAAVRQYELDRTRAKSHPLLPVGMNTINIGVMHGGTGLGEHGLPTVMTNPAIIPDVAVLDLDMKFLPDENSSEYRRDFEEFVHHFAEADAWLRDNPPVIQWELGGLHFPPMNTPVDHPLVRSLMKRKAAIGKTPKASGFVAVCDAAHYAGAGVDGVIFGPSGDGFHGANEYVEVESVVETAKVIAASVIDWCGVR
ncbi:MULTISPECIES: ArgE/DapE family deacylase [unclassified Mesorhizobium]|uniref:M20 family metallopeptidase n=5 Tax=Mesorhizobium TaxID=68287 RepID=UPI000FD84A8A|nr:MULTISPECIES: ArgE/DapE family deacylase [unclassified Mesorhizobium]TGR43479.1 ArgE/DapE family deacylase [bacterium M00.F.Ca.ET.199.01.1.1]TGU39824.1 ArgE/DapE family deacylase [bacterium M00.F.Ca.ET.156.01.1.1]TGV86630.1 ArgE/DapE family deacylase [Mesorhizobium sp. M00.F.Ca.ET.149.01.1.1]TGR27810.1 ArgE/DapE family deacylase [Mesorhizobium sp. M8A.F.Ca.ET.197.01.1.1]TGR31946.1 ArgE/DapE family deacylase [Mesorhizobium sp. M8A.F.Ca.ET.202.01.1.1]